MEQDNESFILLTDIRNILIHQARVQNKLLKMLEENWRLDGTTVTNRFILPNGAPVLLIDFVEAKHRNVPANVSLDVPLKPVAILMIDNLGPGLLSFSTNKHLNQLEAASQILSGGSRTISLNKRAIKQLNVVANGGACTVRVEVLV